MVDISYYGIPIALLIILIFFEAPSRYKSVGVAIHFSFVAIRRGMRDFTGIDDVSFWLVIHGVTSIIAFSFLLYEFYWQFRKEYVWFSVWPVRVPGQWAILVFLDFINRVGRVGRVAIPYWKRLSGGCVVVAQFPFLHWNRRPNSRMDWWEHFSVI